MSDELAALKAEIAELRARVAALEGKPAKKPKAHQIPVDWQPDMADVEWARASYPRLDVDDETDRFRDYWTGTGKPMSNWSATYRNWIRRSAKSAPPEVHRLAGQGGSAGRAAALGQSNRDRADRALDQLAQVRSRRS